MVEPVTTALAGIALVTKSVEIVKKSIGTCKDIGEIIGHVEKAFEGQKQVIRERDKANVDMFSTESVAEEIINARLAQEALYELKLMVDGRFGYGTWDYILKERKRRIDERKQKIKEARAKQLKKQQEIMEYIKYGFIALATVLFIGVSVGITIKFFVSLGHPVMAHDVEYDDNSCMIYEPKYWFMCINESRSFADTELYLDYKKSSGNWIEIEDDK